MTACAEFVISPGILCGAVVVASALVVAQGPSQPASTGARPMFEVASIKRSQPDARGNSFGQRPGGRWTMVNRSIGTLIRAAYPTPVPELVGAPDWVTSESYDVDARADGTPAPEQIRLMLQGLLAERLKLAVHFETQERPVLALVIARRDGRLGPGLLPSKVDCTAVDAARRAGRQPDGPLPANGAPPCAWSGQFSDGVTIRFGGLPLSRLSESLGQPDGRVIVDKTGLTGNFEFTLRYTNQPNPTDDTPSLFTALEDQLGLKLVPDRASLQVLVIDHIERPTEN